LLDIGEVVAALFCLFTVRPPVVVTIENVLAGVELILDDPPGDVFTSVVGHSAATEIVRRASRRTLARVIEMGGFTPFDLSIMRASFIPPAGTGHTV
jgi:hypothetical protein